MNHNILFAMPGNTRLAMALANKLDIEVGSVEIRDFPDGESYIRINSDVHDKVVIIICGLEHPNNKILPLLFVGETLKELGAKKICLISPYLSYMRQDKRFHAGEAVTSTIFAKHLSYWLDCLITIDPHLHRIEHLSSIYSIDLISELHATSNIAKWIRDNIESPFIIGPDEESQQWVTEVAKIANAPYAIIKKIRQGDRKVSMSVPEISDISKTPVLVDDIISTGVSMQSAIQVLISRGLKSPVCIATHALFDNETYNNLLLAGAQKVITCNTIQHPSNEIDITDIVIEEVKRLILDNNP